MTSTLLQIFVSQLSTFLGVFCLAIALGPIPQQALHKRAPYLNTSICLATVPATAVVDRQGHKIAVGWPSFMPETLPGTAPCFPLGATALVQSDDLQPSQSRAPRRVADDAEVDKRPGGIFYCRFANWGSPCYYQALSPSDFGLCWQLEDFDDFFALGPDYGTVLDLYFDPNCKRLAMNDVVYPGFANLSRITSDQKINSIWVKRRDEIGQEHDSH